nr:hypothetical protein 1 [bacterium]
MIDSMIMSQLTGQDLPDVVGPRLQDTFVQVSTYGKIIPEAYGNVRLAGNIIWAQNIKEVEIRETHSAGGGKGGGPTQTSIRYEYYATLAIAICEGEIESIVKVWADSGVLDTAKLDGASGKYNVYLGTEDQLPDSIIESYEGVGNVPAYRGLAYVVIEDFPLAEYGNRIPNFSFEVKRPVNFEPKVEDKIKAITLIPGSGEFVYNTDIRTKNNVEIDALGEYVQTGKRTKVNMHNFNNQANVLESLDQLEKTFPNLEWVSVVVNWFATSKHPALLEIIPKVEFADNISEIKPTEWSVAGYIRKTAQTVLKFPDESLTYGGTPSDDGILQICKELKSRGYNVMLYPMIMVDTLDSMSGEDNKPWRGRIEPTNTTESDAFFTKTNGYNNFILHYAGLSVGGDYLKDYIDALAIGSEMVGMTGFSETTGVYPAVNKFVSLANSVRVVVGSSVKLTYAADWSEYHSKDGWFNLDPLWSSSSIDFVGIDAYFPLTEDLPQSQITEEKIKQGWESGEGWEYYWNGDRNVKTDYPDADYAWKNVEHWWNSTHTNPDSNATAWTAKMKPIWFTEYGFPSVDGCANQPNVFYDPNSVESYFPRASKGRVDRRAQREAINATEDFLEERKDQAGNKDLVPVRFLWTWDARPYPFYPDLINVWADYRQYSTGHWVQGKLGSSTLGAIVANLLEKVGFTESEYDVSRLGDPVEGFFITSQSTVRQALEQLASAYFFDVVEADGILKFVGRGGGSIAEISEDKLIPLKTKPIRQSVNITRSQELELPKQINVSYINKTQDFQTGTQIAQRQTVKAVNILTLNLPIIMSDQEGKNIAESYIYTAWVSRIRYKFTLPPEYARVEPTDIITLSVNGVEHIVRVVSTQFGRNGIVEVMAVAEDISTYDFYIPPGIPTTSGSEGNLIPVTKLELLDLPAFPSDTENTGVIRIAMSGIEEGWKGGVIYRSDDGGETGGNSFNIVTSTDTEAIIGTALNQLSSGPRNHFDNGNVIEVAVLSGELSSITELGVLNGKNSCVVGNEIIQFQNAELISEGRYKLTKLLRGRLGTEHEMSNHEVGDRFVMLDGSVLKESIPAMFFGLERHYKPVTVDDTIANTSEQAFTYTAKTLKPLSPVHIKGEWDGSDNLTISWKRRTRLGGEWRDGVDVPLSEEVEKYEVDIMNIGTVVRTIITATPEATYTATEQTTDFGSVQSSIEVNIYQLSSVVGRGVAGNSIL